MDKKIIVLSGINMTEGGILTIYKECLNYVNSNLNSKYRVIALVHNRNLFEIKKLKNIEFIEFADSKKSWLKRCWYEYYYFKKLSKQLKPYLWLSLHDMTPNVKTEKLAVYCHNSTPFFKMKFKQIKYDKKVYLFSKFYKYLYRINIKRNNFIIVQQNWIAKKFKEMYSVTNLLVAPPNVECNSNNFLEKDIVEKNSFFYPSFPRVFKNFEIICKAAEYLEKEGINNFKIYLTIDGSENLYSREIVEKYKKLKTIKFIGLLSREKVYEYYSKVECLIFPSKLETWGLPITEFKEFNKPMIVANLEYAYETVGDYEKVFFFNPTDAENLKNKIKLVLEKDNKYDRNIKYIKKSEIISWNKLFDILLEEK